jgi:hypothetical protein
MNQSVPDDLRRLEAEAIYKFREVAAVFKNPFYCIRNFSVTVLS